LTNDQLATYEPIKRDAAQKAHENAVATQDLYSFILLKSQRIEVSVDKKQANATCQVEFMMPWNDDETVNNGIRLEIERYALLTMSIHEISNTRKAAGSDNHFRPSEMDESIPLSMNDEPPAVPKKWQNKRSIEIFTEKQDSKFLRVHLTYGPISIYRTTGESQLVCHLSLINKDNENLNSYSSFYSKIDSSQFHELEIMAKHEAHIKQTELEKNLTIARAIEMGSSISESYHDIRHLHENDLKFFIDKPEKSSSESKYGAASFSLFLAISLISYFICNCF